MSRPARRASRMRVLPAMRAWSAARRPSSWIRARRRDANIRARPTPGALSFELSLGPELVVVNGGAPPATLETAREAARQTETHSTLCLDGQSSSRIAPLSEKPNSGLILEGARTKRARRRSTRFGDALSAELYGYVGRYGLRHDRLLILSRDGARLLGQDRLVAVRGAKAGRQSRPFALRFLLHPQAQAALREDGWSVDVTLPSGATLLFVADKAPPQLEPACYYAAPEGPRATTQIVLHGEAAQGERLRWSFEEVSERRSWARVKTARLYSCRFGKGGAGTHPSFKFQ